MNNTKKLLIILSAVIVSALLFGAVSTVIILSTRPAPPLTDVQTDVPETGNLQSTTPPASSDTKIPHQTTVTDTDSSYTKQTEYEEAVKILLSGSPALDSYTVSVMSEEFLQYLTAKCGKSKLISVCEAIKDGTYTAELWYRLTYQSIYALYSGFSAGEDCVFLSGSSLDEITLGFVGDISFADNWDVMSYYGRRKEGLDGIISAGVVSLLRSFDLAAANNEFCVSTRGEPIAKTYTFRAKPENLSFYNRIGIDFVSTANNHIFDYGETALLDTLNYLDEYNISHAGAGKNLSEASKPQYFVINGRKIAILCGSRAEKSRITPTAGENTAGVFGMYSPEAMVIAVKSAAAQSDFVIVFAHWGKEDSADIEEAIRTQAREYIDAGADLIVGAHAHQLQGAEFYKSKLIAYNLGNFLFEEGDLMTGALKITVRNDLSYSAEFIPCRQKDCKTVLSTGEDKREILNYIASLSPEVTVGQNGEMRQKTH